MKLLREGLKFMSMTAVLYSAVFIVLCHIPIEGYPLIYRTSPYYRFKGGVSWHAFQEFRPKEHYNIIILGSSIAYRGYDTRVFEERGARAFVLGSMAQTPLNAYHLLRDQLVLDAPDMVIMDVFGTPFEEDGFEGTAELILNVGSHRAAAGMALAMRDIRMLNIIALRAVMKSKPPVYFDQSYDQRGFAGRHEKAPLLPGPAAERALRMLPMQERYFAECARFCEEHHIQLVLVSAHAPHTSSRERQQVLHSFVDSAIHGTGARYFDLSFDHALSDTLHFYDHSHMNVEGARVFTHTLIDTLRAAALMPRCEGHGTNGADH